MLRKGALITAALQTHGRQVFGTCGGRALQRRTKNTTNLEGVEALLSTLRLSDGGRAAILEARYLAVVRLSCSTAKLVEITCAALSQARHFARNAVVASSSSLCVHAHQLLLVRVPLSLRIAQLRLCVRSFRRFALDSSTSILKCRGES